MGRIKTVLVKRTTRKLLDAHPDKFSTDFTKNKESITELTTCRSKKLKNVIAGYASRLNRQATAPKKKKSFAPKPFNKRR